MSPRVSVITPAYNSEKTLEKSVNSVLTQDFSDLELLIIVNGCTDNTMSVANSLAKNDSRIRVLESRKGKVPSRNLGLIEARGEIVALQDADDEWLPQKLTDQLQRVDDGFDVVAGQILQVDVDGNFLQEQFLWPTSHNDIVSSMLAGHNAVANSAAVFRKSLLEDIGTYEDCFPFCEDFHFWLRAIKFAKFSNLERHVLKYTVTHNPHYDHTIPQALSQFYKSLYAYTGVVKS